MLPAAQTAASSMRTFRWCERYSFKHHSRPVVGLAYTVRIDGRLRCADKVSPRVVSSARVRPSERDHEPALAERLPSGLERRSAELGERRIDTGPVCTYPVLLGGCAMRRPERLPESRVREIRMHGLRGGPVETRQPGEGR